MKSLFSNCIVTAIVHDPELSIYTRENEQKEKE